MYKSIVRPFLFRFNSDTIHESTVCWAAGASRSRLVNGAARSCFGYRHPSLRQELLGLTFPGPVGLAAGFDKNGTFAPLMESLGFGFVEVGSITARPSTGNPKPRSFRLPLDESLVNRMGLNNDGAATICRRLEKHSLKVPLGVNIAKTHDPTITGEAALEDYAESFRLAAPVADYITLNISCPNTAEGKTFEDPEALSSLLLHLKIGSDGALPPVFVKFSVDLDDRLLAELVAASRSHSVSGFVVANTSSERDGLVTPADTLGEIGPGGLSGRAIRNRSTRLISRLFELTRGEKPIIGVGGIFSGRDAIEKLRAGADLVQVYTGLVYEGPGLVRKINREIAGWLRQNGLEHIYQIRKASGLSDTVESPAPSASTSGPASGSSSE